MPVTLFMDKRALLRLNKDMQDLALDFAGSNHMRQPLIKISREVLSPSISKNFAVGGRPKKWEQVGTSAYRSKKGDRAGNSSPLWVTGKMKRSAAAFARWHVARNTLTYGNFPQTSWFAVVHDDAKIAARAGPQGIPHRPFALIQSEDIDASMRIFGDWVEDMTNKHIKRFYFS